jgi:pimeloyl-ACP methyl ester carboxylesterase
MRYLYRFAACLLLSPALVAQVQVMTVTPAATGPSIDIVHGGHTALINPAVPPLNKLLVMIVGTGASSRDQFSFDSFAAEKGYHVISLDYKNTVITTSCSNSTDSSCFDHFRQEIVFGDPVSELVQVDSINSIYHRLYALLSTLSLQYPSQHWQQYLRGSQVDWRYITVAGHSQGAGHAAFLGKRYPVERVLIFAGPQDYLAHFNRPAGWLSQPSVTPPSRYFAFLHLKDPFDFARQLAGCGKLLRQQLTDTVAVTPGLPVTGQPHILVTHVESNNPHGAMLQPSFTQVWAYLLLNRPAVSKK